MHQARLQAYVSVKLTQLGLDVDHQACLELTARIVSRAGELGGFVRLDMESSADTDRNFMRLTEKLLIRGNHPAIATHDERIIEQAKVFAADRHISRESFEFHMLYGIRRDLQERLAEQGYRVRLCVPYGDNWYPYLTRRLAERPANLGFVLRSLAADATRK